MRAGLRSAKARLNVQLEQAYERELCDRFHKLYYDTGIWKRTQWLATPVQKLPLDLGLVQELIVELRPDLLIETGTLKGAPPSSTRP